MWHGGVTSEPLIKKPKNRVKKKAASIKQSLKSRQPFRRKQRRISSYVTRSSRPQLHQRSTYGDGDPSFNAGEAAPPRDETISFLIQDDSPMETDELPQTRSPIISQYEAQLHRDSTADHLASSPVSDPCIHTQSVHVSPNHNNTSVHTSPDHNIDSVQVSPIYLGTIHHTPPVSQMITHTNDATDDYNEPPRTPVSVQPPWSELNSVVYDKSDHPTARRFITFSIMVFHTTPHSFEFSNKFLLELAKPKQWTTTRHKEILIHMLTARHSTHLLSEKSTFTTPLLPSYICNSWADFAPCRKRSTFVWDERLVDIVLHQGKKWMEDIHNIYTLMLWNSKH
ncbi:hypothetical protein F2Q70_00026362 [Brassica cretica]|uniref:DUF1985 domain-containing protein n=1 Tax=Brassica cretica TaxID=69181 RepID=A0A8S9L8S0_BRACR|nr:hypothetical protein F2Q70_00026362 [Brassica cretica]